ncbi:hypothetical protein NMW45_07575 [Pasteurella multocida]|uniref:hypothetical protein n=1 Tax=Pasteurella multocida TaxID=747 RepID=UPI002A51E975|nr:hypothetical protein [Pasteurella multocida]MDY0475588.1 hypothetical protein [Pasteurella multocida]MDY0523190.1 hypothetical protein [Pasteurella multocida]MDY0588791.1 hypothetical protein [Pasteurella multocida]MDY0609186.1 hypothetical protein [Pasteurella multocida]
MDAKIMNVLLIVLFSVIVICFLLFQESRLKDPNNHSVIYSEQIQELCCLDKIGSYKIDFIRQSGNEYKESVLVDDFELAIKTVLSTLRKAKIDSVSVISNTSDLLLIYRAFYNARGSQEGKKLGAIRITKI